ncbi:MAG TPA: hypothetical protein VGU03_11140 [Frateuria sp.]|uniref:hypothetical protein n=1 Tax=Frateuria sp. TaxID=2211372 RepID=UPI002DF308A9|nr:hypothetical protein [Frateuria sp.]
MAKPPKKKVPGSHVSLSLRQPCDLLAKLEWEADALRRYWDTDLLGPSYCLLNGAITAWQLGDWVAGTLDDAKRWDLADAHFGVEVRSLFDLQTRMRECRALVACQQMAAVAKHMKINDDGTYRPGFRAYEMFDIYALEMPDPSDGPQLKTVRVLEVRFPVEEENDRPTHLVYSARLVLDEAIAWWQAALEGMGLDVGAPAIDVR